MLDWCTTGESDRSTQSDWQGAFESCCVYAVCFRLTDDRPTPRIHRITNAPPASPPLLPQRKSRPHAGDSGERNSPQALVCFSPSGVEIDFVEVKSVTPTPAVRRIGLEFRVGLGVATGLGFRV